MFNVVITTHCRQKMAYFFSEKEMYRVAQIDEYMDMPIEPSELPAKPIAKPYYSNMVTIQIDGGKKAKLRAGDILGALTGQGGIDGKSVGKINLFAMRAYVAVERSVAKKALNKSAGRIRSATCWWMNIKIPTPVSIFSSSCW